MTTPHVVRRPISGGQVMLTLAAIALATAVLPPAAAWWLNASRIAETQARADDAVGRLRARASGVEGFGSGIGVACGPGRLPDAVPSTATARLAAASRAVHDAWILGAVTAPELFGDGMPTDAWGRCFLMNVDAHPRTQRIWILSAGPNGIIDTPLGALTLAGDDIGAIVR